MFDEVKLGLAPLILLDSYDVNVTPDKRTIFIHNEERLVNFIIVSYRHIVFFHRNRTETKF